MSERNVGNPSASATPNRQEDSEPQGRRVIPHRSLLHLPSPADPTDTSKVLIIIPSPPSSLTPERQYFVPYEFIPRCKLLSDKLSDLSSYEAIRRTIRLPQFHFSYFQSMLDFFESGEYLRKREEADFYQIRIHIDHWIFGNFMGCESYCTVALCSLHETCQKLPQGLNSLDYTDFELAIKATSETPDSPLCNILFDGIAGVLSDDEVIQIQHDAEALKCLEDKMSHLKRTDGTPVELHLETLPVSWGSLYNNNAEFRSVLSLPRHLRRKQLRGTIYSYIGAAATPVINDPLNLANVVSE